MKFLTEKIDNIQKKLKKYIEKIIYYRRKKNHLKNQCTYKCLLDLLSLSNKIIYQKNQIF